MKRHMSMNIKGVLNRTRNIKGLLFDEEGACLSDSEAREYLNECLSNGWSVIPIGECDNFDYQKGCFGHAIRHYCKYCNKTLQSADEVCDCEESIKQLNIK